jgi:heat shock protein HslJ
MMMMVGVLLPLIAGCQSNKVPADFSAVKESRWILAEIRTVAGGTVVLDRERNGEVFTLRFEEEMAFGTGAPNTFSGPYTRENDRLSFGPAVSTRMASFTEPEELTEHEYFGYLAATVSWDMEDGNLLLYTSGEGEVQTILMFAPL